MVNEYFEYQLNNENGKKYKNMSIEQLHDLAKDFNDMLPSAEYDNSTMFDFYVNQTMQGSPHPCAEIKCRMNNIERTLRFGALYAERLVFVNRFDLIRNEIENARSENLNKLRFALMTEIEIHNRLRFFINSGMIKYGKSNFHFCESCMKKSILNTKGSDEFINKMLTKLEEKYLSDLSAEYENVRGHNLIRIHGPQEIIPHGAYITEIHSPLFNERSDIFTKTKRVKLDSDTIKNLGITDRINKDLFHDIVYGNFYSTVYGTQTLTDNQFEFEINKQYRSRNMSDDIIDSIEHSMPFILDVDVDRILELRMAEGDAFNNYRELVRGAIKEIKTLDNTYEKAQAFSDIIRPGISDVETKIKKSKTKLLRTLTKDIAIIAGSIYLATNNTMFDPTMANYIAAGGGLEAFRDLMSNTKILVQPEIIVKDEKMYFLWKLKKMAPKV